MQLQEWPFLAIAKTGAFFFCSTKPFYKTNNAMKPSTEVLFTEFLMDRRQGVIALNFLRKIFRSLRFSPRYSRK